MPPGPARSVPSRPAPCPGRASGSGAETAATLPGGTGALPDTASRARRSPDVTARRAAVTPHPAAVAMVTGPARFSRHGRAGGAGGSGSFFCGHTCAGVNDERERGQTGPQQRGAWGSCSHFPPYWCVQRASCGQMNAVRTETSLEILPDRSKGQILSKLWVNLKKKKSLLEEHRSTVEEK